MERNFRALRSIFAALAVLAAATMANALSSPRMSQTLIVAQVGVPTPTPTPITRPTPTPTPAPPVATRSPRPLPRGIAPPTAIYPTVAAVPANPPFAFLWTPVTGATAYELQLSDRPDVRSHVLFDVSVGTTVSTFTNINAPGSGFTSLQPNGMPLPGGPYYWRVRAIAGSTSTIFSQVAHFRLGTVPGGMPLHDLAVAAIGIAGTPVSGLPSAISVRVENRGAFAVEGANILVTVNGLTIGAQDVQPLSPGEAEVITLPWTAAAAGFANIVATLDYADDVPSHKAGSYSVAVEPQKPVAATFLGTIGGACGSYVLLDNQGNTIAQLVPAPGASSTTLLSLYNQTASVTGDLSIGAAGPQITVRSARPAAGGANPRVRNPCLPPASGRMP